MFRAEGGSLLFWGPGLLSTSPAFSMSSASHSAGSSGRLAPKNGSWAHFPVGRDKLMPFVDPDRIEQSDRVQAASFAPCLKMLLLLSTPLHQRAASRVQHPNHVAASSLSPQVARKGSTLSGFVQRSRLEREVGRDLHSNKWEEV